MEDVIISDKNRKEHKRDKKSHKHRHHSSDKSDDGKVGHKRRQRSKSPDNDNKRKYNERNREINSMDSAYDDANHQSMHLAAVTTESIAESKPLVSASNDGSVSSSTPSIVSTQSKSQFFQQLLLKESNQRIGTVHASKPKPVAIPGPPVSSGEWECSKCSHKNMKYANQCEKCKAIKRLTEFRK